MRPCLVAPITEMELAASLLSQATDAIVSGDFDGARELISGANLAPLNAHACLAMKDGQHIRRRLRREARPAGTRPAVPRSLERKILARDGYRCRYCGCKVVLKEARKQLSNLLPGAISWGRDASNHAAFHALQDSVDHVVPWSSGGTNAAENLVTACRPCNFGKADNRLEELDLIDPREKAPVIDDWDGLERVANLSIRSARARVSEATAGDDQSLPVSNGEGIACAPATASGEWLSRLDLLYPRASSGLTSLLNSLANKGVSWHLRNVLILRLTVGEHRLDVLGIEPNGDVEFPWSIGDQKGKFKSFAMTLASAIPGARVVETPKMWRVKGSAGRLTVEELLDVSVVLCAALSDLKAALEA